MCFGANFTSVTDVRLSTSVVLFIWCENKIDNYYCGLKVTHWLCSKCKTNKLLAVYGVCHLLMKNKMYRGTILNDRCESAVLFKKKKILNYSLTLLPSGFALDVCHWTLQQFPPILLQYGQMSKMPTPVQTLDEPMSLSKPSHCESTKHTTLVFLWPYINAVKSNLTQLKW